MNFVFLGMRKLINRGAHIGIGSINWQITFWGLSYLNEGCHASETVTLSGIEGFMPSSAVSLMFEIKVTESFYS